LVDVTLSSIESSYASVVKLNDNFDLIEEGFQDAVSKTVPSTMSTVIDMNGYQLLNLAEPTSNGNAATKLYVDTLADALAATTVADASDYTVLVTGGTQALSLDTFFSGYVDARAFGIASTNSAAVNSAALQAAVTAASSANKTLLFPPGRIKFSGTTATPVAIIPTTGLRVQGMGGKYGTTLVHDGADDFYLFSCVDGDYIEFSNIGFDGEAVARVAWQKAFVLRGCRHIVIKDCYFYRQGDSVCSIGTEGFGGSDGVGNGSRRTEIVQVVDNVFENIYGSICFVLKYNGGADITVSNNIFKSGATCAISIESEDGLVSNNYQAERVTITGNTIYNCSYLYSSGTSDIAYGIAVSESVRKLVIANNVIDTVTGNTVAAGILIGTSPTQDDETVGEIIAANNSISNVTAAAGRGHGVWLSMGDASMDTISIDSNIIKACKDGITMQMAAGAKTLGTLFNCNITNNLVYKVTEFGIWTDTTSSAGDVPLKYTNIANNIITLSGSHAMTLKADGVGIYGNYIKGAGGAGVNMINTSQNNNFFGNTITDCSGNGIVGDFDRSNIHSNFLLRNGQTENNGYGCYCSTAATNISFVDNRSEDDGVAGLAIGSNQAYVSNLACSYFIGGVEYTLAANAVGTAPGNDVVPINKYGCVAFEIGTDGTLDAIEASDNSTGYNTAALAVAGLPAVQANHVRLGWVTAIKTDGAFTFGTTNLNAANVTAAYTSGVQDYGFRTTTHGQTVRSNHFVGNARGSTFDAISNENTGTYDAALNRTA